MKLQLKTATGGLILVFCAGLAAGQLTTIVPRISSFPCPLAPAVAATLPPGLMFSEISIMPIIRAEPVPPLRPVMPVIPIMPVLRPESLRSPLLAVYAKGVVAKDTAVKDALDEYERLGIRFDGAKKPAHRMVVAPGRRIGIPEQDLEKEIGAINPRQN